ncbi:Rho GTPase activation protein [Marasmius fiardii PR-910]|nr:Rho GTPase activation protein [Marasmius fiardii PR-910]
MINKVCRLLGIISATPDGSRFNQNKFWNVRVTSRRRTSKDADHEEGELSYAEEKQNETLLSLKDKLVRMEQQVHRILVYLNAIRKAEKFILHVEVLFATMDDLEFHFARLNIKVCGKAVATSIPVKGGGSSLEMVQASALDSQAASKTVTPRRGNIKVTGSTGAAKIDDLAAASCERLHTRSLRRGNEIIWDGDFKAVQRLEQKQTYSSKPAQIQKDQGQAMKPAFSKNNATSMTVDHSVPNSPPIGCQIGSTIQEGITLAGLPRLMKVVGASEQQQSPPRSNSMRYIAELTTLELTIVKHSAILALTESPLKSRPRGAVEARGAERNKEKKGVFGSSLEVLVEKEGVESSLGASGAPLRVPSFIDDLISALRQMDMSVEGVFRKGGNIRRLRELTDAINRDALSVDLTQENPSQLTALLKKFLRDLPVPLLTFKLYQLIIVSQSLPNEADRIRLLHMLSIILPKPHRMEVLFVFLKWVALFVHVDDETGSKMDLENLATIITPSILYRRGLDSARDESFAAIRAVASLLENQDEFFTVPEEFMSVLYDQGHFTKYIGLPAKDFMKICDRYRKLHHSGEPA